MKTAGEFAGNVRYTIRAGTEISELLKWAGRRETDAVTHYEASKRQADKTYWFGRQKAFAEVIDFWSKVEVAEDE